MSTLKLRVVSVVGNQSSLLQREWLFCRSDLRIATFTRKISVDTPLVTTKSESHLQKPQSIDMTFVTERGYMTAPKAKALGFFSSFSVLNFGRWASFAYCDMLLGFYRVFVWLFQLIENSPSDLINLSNVEVAPARGAATGFLLSPK